MAVTNYLLKVHPYYNDIRDLADNLRGQPAHIRRRVMRRTVLELTSTPNDLKENARVGLVKTLLALLPESDGPIRKLVGETGTTMFAEIQFSLFCFFDRVPEFASKTQLCKDIPILVEQYLRKVNSEGALAPWMAGDMLGDHWNLREGVPRLISVLRKARYVAGRKGALHGLDMALQRSRGHVRNRIESALRNALRSDRSHKIRTWSKMILEGVGPPRPAGISNEGGLNEAGVLKARGISRQKFLA